MTTKSERRKCTTEFQPYNDQDLISYLQKFVCGMPIETDRIGHIDVYGNKKPCELFQDLLCSKEETSNDHVNYFFTQLKKKSASGKNYNRSITGGGSWKGRDTSKAVHDKEGSIIGLKKTFRFDEECSDHQRIVWNMKEYCLSDNILEVLRQRCQIRHEDYVLCSVERKVNLCKHSQDIPSEISSSALRYGGWPLYTELTKLPPLIDGPFESLTEEELAFFDNPDPGYPQAYEKAYFNFYSN
ncbi:NAC domain containing protein 50-like [Nicotiana tabacum]|uniref:NAC domain containing protein 50-like n=1 Tax=Nicotiana tabacum TaxID=4097 RepID=A0A1S3Z356_TOBAC|nr:NAC domain-containing protein 1-like [Nicotiana tomentosiformis]XP_016458602.1 PREDICTED: NAC domain-containing protein 76-like [Nicotiana tabacum]